MHEERSHLILTRREGQSLTIGDDLTVTVITILPDRVRVGIRAPRDVPIYRNEVLEAMRDSVRPPREGEVRTEAAPGQEGEGGGS